MTPAPPRSRLIAPVIYAFHHQHDLGGTQDNPIDIDQFLTACHRQGQAAGRARTLETAEVLT